MLSEELGDRDGGDEGSDRGGDGEESERDLFISCGDGEEVIGDDKADGSESLPKLWMLSEKEGAWAVVWNICGNWRGKSGC